MAFKFWLSFVVLFILASILYEANKKVENKENRERMWDVYLFPLTGISFFGAFASLIWLIWE